MAKRGRKSWKEMLDKDFDWNYGTINGKYSKYKKGDRITDFKVLLQQDHVIVLNRCISKGFLLSQQLRYVIGCFERGEYYFAILKNEKDGKEDGR